MPGKRRNRLHSSRRDHSERHRRRSSCWQSVLTWGLVWIVAGQAAAVVFLECRHPEFLDPKYGCRMLALRALRKDQAERKLFLVLGSSRAEQGFRPSILTRTVGIRDPHRPLFYNLARGGSSPLLYLVTLRRSLADGIRPDALLVEIFPPALVEDEDAAVVYKPTLRDVPLLSRYPISARSWAFWFQDRLLFWYKYRSGLLAWAAPQLLPTQARWGEHLWDYQGGEWRVIGSYLSALERRRLTEDARHRYAPSLQHFRIADDADRALRELFEICRTQHIRAVLFLMPECSDFRRWYTSDGLSQLSNYLAVLCRDYSVPLIDARRWIEDSDFSDGHHLLSRGAAVFTWRFAHEVRSFVNP